ncbi:MAG TPA: hypothetical protein VL284_07915 [Thermoanaerobaculia bacterium]|nr:hypothetical protein [Thermoanaerobaculia bacterium]
MLSLLFAAAAYWTVHIDVPRDHAAFERIDAQYDAAVRDFYESHRLAAPALWRIATADGAHIALRPRGTMAELAAPQLPAGLANELQTKTAPISDATHKTLRAHHSEIWHVESDLTNFTKAKKYAMLRTDLVQPPNDDAYDSEMKQIVTELAANGIETLGFFSSYGDGAYHYIFTSDKPVHVRTLPKFCTTHDVKIRSIEIR